MHTIVFTMETENTHLFGKDPQIGWICPDAKRLTNQTKQWMKLTNKNHNFFGRRKLLLDFASWLRAEIQLSDRQWGVKLHVTRTAVLISIYCTAHQTTAATEMIKVDLLPFMRNYCKGNFPFSNNIKVISFLTPFTSKVCIKI